MRFLSSQCCIFKDFGPKVLKLSSVLMLMALMVSSCASENKNKDSKIADKETSEQSAGSPTSESKKQIEKYYPRFTSAQKQELMAKANGGDLVFSDYGISMGIPSNNGAKGFINFIVPDRDIALSDCAPDISLYLNDAMGNDLGEFFIFFEGDCHHVGKVENGKITQAADLAPEALEFFSNMVLNYKKQTGQQ